MIKEIMYLPTMLCNYSCKHCDQGRYNTKNEELSCKEIANIVKRSIVSKNLNVINIAGGEPFVKEGLEEFVLEIINDETLNIHIFITTNGYFTKKIESLISKIKYPEKVCFGISIDGLSETHNKIRGNRQAYIRAIETINILKQYKIKVQVNSVVQHDNIRELEQFKEEIKKYVDKQCFIPELSVANKGRNFVFNDEEIKTILPYIDTNDLKKYLLSKGACKIEKCHAGLSNIVIDPTGKVYTCFMGYSYLDKKSKDKYYMGDLKIEELDSIINQNRIEALYNKNIRTCQGCFSPCENAREVEYYDYKFELSKDELAIALEHISSNQRYLLDSKWYDTEYLGERKFNWMKGNEAKFYIKRNSHQDDYLTINYLNFFPDKNRELSVNIYVNEELMNIHTSEYGENKVQIYLGEQFKETLIFTVKFEISFYWKPADYTNKADNRVLGIALLEAQFSNSYIEQEDNYNRLNIDDLEIKLDSKEIEALVIKKDEEEVRLPLWIYNNTRQVLASKMPYPIYVTYRILDADKRYVLVDEGIRSELGAEIKFGQKQCVETRIACHELNAGNYIVRITLVQEWQFWLNQVNDKIEIDLVLIIE